MRSREPADQEFANLGALPHDAGEPVFPTPWAARAFALALALSERGLFTWSEWAEALGARLAGDESRLSVEAEAYWQAWLAALEDLAAAKQLAGPAELAELREAWRQTAEATPHGEPLPAAPVGGAGPPGDDHMLI